jgi:hypothetical protein
MPKAFGRHQDKGQRTSGHQDKKTKDKGRQDKRLLDVRMNDFSDLTLTSPLATCTEFVEVSDSFSNSEAVFVPCSLFVSILGSQLSVLNSKSHANPRSHHPPSLPIYPFSFGSHGNDLLRLVSQVKLLLPDFPLDQFYQFCERNLLVSAVIRN